MGSGNGALKWGQGPGLGSRAGSGVREWALKWGQGGRLGSGTREWGQIIIELCEVDNRQGSRASGSNV